MSTSTVPWSRLTVGGMAFQSHGDWNVCSGAPGVKSAVTSDDGRVARWTSLVGEVYGGGAIAVNGVTCHLPEGLTMAEAHQKGSLAIRHSPLAKHNAPHDRCRRRAAPRRARVRPGAIASGHVLAGARARRLALRAAGLPRRGEGISCRARRRT